MINHDKNKHQCIAVAVSGGADSLYALIKLKEKYHNVIAIHGIFLNYNSEFNAVFKHIEQKDNSFILDKNNSWQFENNNVIMGLSQICDLLEIPLHIIQLNHIFLDTVIKPFIESYAKGNTPNPCVDCNVNMKFGELWEYSQKFKAHKIATGHYASMHKHAIYGKCLQQSHDHKKDQSYFLSLVPINTLKSAIFPLNNTLKHEAIDYLDKLGIQIPAPKESQDICFIPHELQHDYRPYIEEQAQKYGIELGKYGEISLREGQILGQHRGLWNYTEGQRRGLGISWHEPLYVCHKDTANNKLILGNKDQCLIQQCFTEQANLLVQPELWPKNLLVRIRYRQSNLPAKVSIIANSLHIYFEQKQQSSASGQIAAVYDNDNILLAAARIKKCI